MLTVNQDCLIDRLDDTGRMRKLEKIKVICLYCGKARFVLQSYINAGGGKYCNHKCHSEALKGKLNEALQEGRKKVQGSNHFFYGKHLTEEHRRKISENHADMSGDKSPSWKGDNVGYYGIHDWIVNIAGKPQKCDKCESEKQQRYEWANRSRLYKRERSDWIRLCVFCHRKADYHQLPL